MKTPKLKCGMIGPAHSKHGVIELYDIEIDFEQAATKNAHRMGVMRVVRKHLEAMRKELATTIKGVRRVGRAKVDFDIFV